MRTSIYNSVKADITDQKSEVRTSEHQQEKKCRNKLKNRNKPWCIELDDDKIVLADSVVEVGVIQCENELLGLRLVSGDLRRKRGKEREQGHKEEANRNPTRHCTLKKL
ncbi:hypothetical protein CR513_50622, partial [Mucuna pruriens]